MTGQDKISHFRVIWAKSPFTYYSIHSQVTFFLLLFPKMNFLMIVGCIHKSIIACSTAGFTAFYMFRVDLFTYFLRVLDLCHSSGSRGERIVFWNLIVEGVERAELFSYHISKSSKSWPEEEPLASLPEISFVSLGKLSLFSLSCLSKDHFPCCVEGFAYGLVGEVAFSS